MKLLKSLLIKLKNVFLGIIESKKNKIIKVYVFCQNFFLKSFNKNTLKSVK